MNMKYILIVIISCFSIIPVKAQLNMGIEAGAGISGVLASNVDTRLKSGARMGMFVNYSVGKDDFFETGISFVSRGYDITNFLPSYTEYVKRLDMRMGYLEIPFMIGFNYLLSEKNQVRAILKAGIYLAWGVSGNGVLTGLTGENKLFEERIDDGFKNEEFITGDNIYGFTGFEKFDIGAKVGLDLIVKSFTVRLAGTYGFKNMNPTYNKSLRSTGLDIALGYHFTLIR